MVATWVYCYFASRVVLLLVDKLVGLRATAESERVGLDISEHNERAYQI